MRRRLLLLVLTCALSATAAPALAQSGGATAPDPDTADSGGAGYDPAARALPKAPARRSPARRRRARKQRSARRRRPPPAAPAPLPAPPARRGHRFPLVGPFSFGQEGSRFGAARRGHTHQGQDVAAAEGTPIVAPRTGTVEVVAYQASAAGHYVVLDGAGEDRDYVFMHLRSGSTVVTEGQRVRIGAPLGEVGTTGASTGPHLHFEVWVRGGWYTGGEPIDPLPLLRRWSR